MSLVRFRLWAFFVAQKQDSHFFAIAKSGRISCPLSKKTLHHIPGNSRMDTVQSFFHRMTAQESFSFLQIFDDLPRLIIKFSVLEIILFIFFCNLFYHTATLQSEISFVTTLPAPITTLLPICTPGTTTVFPPSHTLSPIVTSIPYS